MQCEFIGVGDFSCKCVTCMQFTLCISGLAQNGLMASKHHTTRFFLLFEGGVGGGGWGVGGVSVGVGVGACF